MVDRGTFTSQEIRFMDETITIQAKVESRALSKSFTPDNWSVICGRGKQSYGHVGNKRLRVLVESKLEAYTAAKSKIAKTLIVTSIVDTIRDASQTGGFVKLNTKTGQYYEVGDAVAREKVGQLLREAMAKRNPAKISERKEQRRKAKAAKKTALTPTTTTKSRLSVVSNDAPMPPVRAPAPFAHSEADSQLNMINLAKLQSLGRQHEPPKSDYEPLPYDDSSTSGSSSSSSSAGMQWLSDLAGERAAC